MNPLLFALQCLVDGEYMPYGCYNEIPKGTRINSLKIENKVAYLDLDTGILSNIDNINYSYDVIFDILSFNIFKFGVEKIEYSFNGSKNENVKDIDKEKYFKPVESARPQAELNQKMSDFKKETEGMTKKQIVEYLSKKVSEKRMAANSVAALTYDPVVTKVCIDPGHGGTDPGTSGTYNGTTYYEDDINLSIALYLKTYLENYGYTVYMTRTTDTTVSLTSRYTLANNNSVGCFVAVHCNGVTDSSVHGTTCIYPANHDIAYSQDLAQWVHNYVTTFDFTSYSDPYKDNRGLAVLNGTHMPAIITETGFMSNSSDMAHLASSTNRDSIAEDIYCGVASWDVYGEY